MESISALLALCEENPSITGGFPLQTADVTGFDILMSVKTNGYTTIESPVIWDAMMLIVTSL